MERFHWIMALLVDQETVKNGTLPTVHLMLNTECPHIDKVLAYLKGLNDEGVEDEVQSKRRFSSIDDISDNDLGYLDETDGVPQDKNEFFGIGDIIKLIKKGINLVRLLFKPAARLPKKIMAKASSKIDVKKAAWSGIPNGNHPKVKELIGDAAEVVLKETGDNLRTTLQYADTEEGPGFLYKVEDPNNSNQIIDSGYRKSDTNLVDTVVQVIDYLRFLAAEAITGVDMTPELN